MKSFATYDISISGTKADIREALFCLADAIFDQETTISELIDKYDADDDIEDEDEEYTGITLSSCNEDIEIWQTHDCVWIEDIQKLAEEIVSIVPEIIFSFAGHIEDCSDEAGDEMDFKITYKGKKLTLQKSDWYQYIHMDDFKNYAVFASRFHNRHGQPRYSEEDYEGFRECADEWYVLDGGNGEFSTNAPLGEPVRIKLKKPRYY